MVTMPGVAAFGHFQAIVQFAATLSCRGILVRSGEPMTIDEVAIKIGTLPAMLKKSWVILTDPKIGWIQEVEFDPNNLPERVWISHKSATAMPRESHQSASAVAEDRQIVGPACASARVHPPTHPKQPTHKDPPLPPADGGRERASEFRLLMSHIEPLYAAYPSLRRGGKGGFMRAVEPVWGLLHDRGVEDPGAVLLKAVRAYANSWLAKNDGGKAVLGPQRFFGEGVWEQSPSDWRNPETSARNLSPEEASRRQAARAERERADDARRSEEQQRILAQIGRKM